MADKSLDVAPSYYLEPGYIYFTRTSSTIRTVVGSCVAVCLWDKNLKYGGMNHFLRPLAEIPDQATPLYGNVATLALLQMMADAGCQSEDLVAQVLGGASPDGDEGRGIGHENVEIARSVLHRKGVGIQSEDIGGHMGRKIAFDTSTGQLVTLKVHKLRKDDWITDREGRNGRGERGSDEDGA